MRYRRFSARREPPRLQLSRGIRREDYEPDEDEVYETALRLWRRSSRMAAERGAQLLAFDKGPLALTFVADLHLGDRDTNYPRLFAEAELIANTPGMYVGLVGDLVNNFIIGKLTQLRLETRLAIPDEVVLLRRYLRLIGSKVLMSCGGNHEYWSTLVSGLDYFRDIVAEAAPGALVDPDQIDVVVQVGETCYPGRVRHRWRRRSIYNATHGIEAAYKWEHFGLWGVAAHYHESGLAREFNADGQTGLALVCGSYKPEERYARRLGFPAPNAGTAVTVVFTEADGMLGFSNLRLACDYMEKYYGEDE